MASLLTLSTFFMFFSSCGGLIPNATVALDGSGNYKTVGEAIIATPSLSPEPYVIYIKKGVYKEYINIAKDKWNLMLIGDGIGATIISGSRSNGSGWKTIDSATFGVSGQGFIDMDMTFENTAGPGNGQAVAFRSDSGKSAMFRCAFRGYQDALYAHSNRQFYRECIITGTVDFIFGDAIVVFQNCTILAQQGQPGQKNTVTAQGRSTASGTSGFSIQFCTISAEAGMLSSTQSFLGRPWRLFSRTVVMQSYLSEAIHPRGWLEWNGGFGLDSLFYGEYQNRGPGATVSQRVNWSGFHIITDPNIAATFTVAKFIGGDLWLPATGVNYTPGLVP